MLDVYKRQVEDRGLVVKMISDEETHAIASHYVSALADAVIRFESVSYTHLDVYKRQVLCGTGPAGASGDGGLGGLRLHDGLADPLPPGK